MRWRLRWPQEALLLEQPQDKSLDVPSLAAELENTTFEGAARHNEVPAGRDDTTSPEQAVNVFVAVQDNRYAFKNRANEVRHPAEDTQKEVLA